jgi:hypothetical protein
MGQVIGAYEQCRAEVKRWNGDRGFRYRDLKDARTLLDELA